MQPRTKLNVRSPIQLEQLLGPDDPEDAAATFRDEYGPAAAEAAAQCVIAALNDHRESDHRFWIAVSAELSKSDGTAAAAPEPLKY